MFREMSSLCCVLAAICARNSCAILEGFLSSLRVAKYLAQNSLVRFYLALADAIIKTTHNKTKDIIKCVIRIFLEYNMQKFMAACGGRQKHIRCSSAMRAAEKARSEMRLRIISIRL